MAVSGMRSIFLMPCYNYCPIASTAHRKSAQAEGSSCSGGKCDCNVSKPCSNGLEGSYFEEGSTRLKTVSKEGRTSCPIIGDIENWPPVMDDDETEDNFQRGNQSGSMKAEPQGKCLIKSFQKKIQTNFTFL